LLQNSRLNNKEVVSLKAHMYKMGILLFFILTLITACSTVTKDNNLNSEISSVDDSSHIKEEDVVNVLKENHVELIETEFSQNNTFGTKLNNVEPGSYKLSEKRLFIYEYKTEEDREKGIKDFNEMTATMNLVSYNMFVKRNVLIFYVHEQDLNSLNIPYEKEIQEGLNNLIEG
jgi:hypothetical protein